MMVTELTFLIAKALYQSAMQNRKIGQVYSWSLPAVSTCPGATEECIGACYARRLSARRANVAKGWNTRFEWSKHVDFAAALTAALSMLPSGLLRIHVSGDFYSTEYIKAWAVALQANGHIKAWAYTRSWRIPQLHSAIVEAFDGWPTWLLASVDSQTGMPDDPAIRMAPMIRHRKPHMKPVSPLAASNGALFICPQQTGKLATCADCGACGGVKLANGALVELAKIPRHVAFARH